MLGRVLYVPPGVPSPTKPDLPRCRGHAGNAAAQRGEGIRWEAGSRGGAVTPPALRGSAAPTASGTEPGSEASPARAPAAGTGAAADTAAGTAPAAGPGAGHGVGPDTGPGTGPAAG